MTETAAAPPPAGPLAGQASPSTSSEPLDRATIVVAGVVIIGAMMSILDATVVNVALNTLGRELHSSLATIQKMISGSTLALGSVIPVSGWAADRFGAKQMWHTAVVVFAGGSLLCGVAWSAGSPIAFRVLQGIGGGVLTPRQAQLSRSDQLRGGRRPRGSRGTRALHACRQDERNARCVSKAGAAHVGVAFEAPQQRH